MKLELNYDCKTITVKDQINLKEFIKEVKKLGLDLKEWNVVSDTIWTTYPSYPIFPLQPYYQEPYYYTTSDGTGTIVGSDNLTTSTDTVQITSVTTNC